MILRTRGPCYTYRYFHPSIGGATKGLTFSDIQKIPPKMKGNQPTIRQVILRVLEKPTFYSRCSLVTETRFSLNNQFSETRNAHHVHDSLVIETQRQGLRQGDGRGWVERKLVTGSGETAFRNLLFWNMFWRLDIFWFLWMMCVRQFNYT